MSDLLPSHNAAYNKLLAEATTLRAKVLRDADDLASLRKQLKDARSEALEEAANLVDSQPDNGISFQALWRIAGAIRALKGKS